MLTFTDMQDLYKSRLLIVDERDATKWLIHTVYGQVQAFVSDEATPKHIADQLRNMLLFLHDNYVKICMATLNIWHLDYVENTTVLPNGIRFTNKT